MDIEFLRVRNHLLLFAEHKARIKISSKALILTVFPPPHSILLQMLRNLSVDSYQHPTVHRLVNIFYLASDGLLSGIMRILTADPGYKGEQVGEPWIFGRTISNVLSSALLDWIGEISSQCGTECMLVVMHLCVASFMCFPLSICNKNCPAHWKTCNWISYQRFRAHQLVLPSNQGQQSKFTWFRLLSHRWSNKIYLLAYAL